MSDGASDGAGDGVRGIWDRFAAPDYCCLQVNNLVI